ncbi:type IX secretion system membrane protein PorP/SprF [Reichenbachiella sp. MALMAid0571]|uniref:PorP/SprF family type IX secretion system membrane protein n=1 Tax=Reichenbachiella sp. MALMAid0571 TaxID=3143939 RepID=UPI0032DE5E6F
MKVKQAIIVSTLLIGTNGVAFGQLGPVFGQYLFNQALFNPAYTGVNDAFHATAISRQQWIGVEGAPVTNALNVTSSFIDNKIGVGLLMINDQFGVNNNTEIQAMYSYQIEMLNSRSLSFGLQTGYTTYQFDFSKLNLEQPDQALQTTTNNTSETNFGAGVYFQSKNYYAGISIPKILNNNELDKSRSRFNQKVYMSGGIVLDQFILLKFKPSALLVFVEGEMAIIDLNAQFLLVDALWVGASLRNFSTIGINGQFKFKSNLRLGYSFELPFNEIGNTAFSTHELMVSIDLALFKGQGVGVRYF